MKFVIWDQAATLQAKCLKYLNFRGLGLIMISVIDIIKLKILIHLLRQKIFDLKVFHLIKLLKKEYFFIILLNF